MTKPEHPLSRLWVRHAIVITYALVMLALNIAIWVAVR